MIDCERYIREYKSTNGFFGADCHTWFGGFSGNCRQAEAQAKAQRDLCLRNQQEIEITRIENKELIKFVGYAAAFISVFLFIKWYLK